MPSRRFPLDIQGELKNLEIHWDKEWQSFTFILDGEEVSQLGGGSKRLSRGHHFQLPDGSRVHVKLDAKTSFLAQFVVSHNGRPITDDSPLQLLRRSYTIVYFVGVLNLLLAAAFYLGPNFFDTTALNALGLGLGWWTLLSGLLLTGLGYGVEKRMLPALVAAIVIYLLDGGQTVSAAIQAGLQPNLLALVAKLFFIWYMVQGIGVIQSLSAKSGEK